MTLELTQLSTQVQAMGKSITNQNEAKKTAIQHAKALLQEYATAFNTLDTLVHKAEQVQEAVRFNWLGAAHANEPLDQAHPTPNGPEQVTILASDGSQIYPDRHAITLYYLINIGMIVYRQGINQAPETQTLPTLFYEEEDLLDAQGFLHSPSIVNVKRDLGELEVLANLAAAYYEPSSPTLALMDGRLTLRTIDLPGREQQFYETQYIACLNRLREHDAIIAACIDRPFSSFILALLHLATLTPDKITEETLRNNPFVSLSDADLLADLKPGERTALFKQRAKANLSYNKAGHEIHFFYLNTGPVNAPNLMRVEIPIWVAKDQEKLNLLHATLLRQAKMAGGYPYVLARAHELAIIPPKEREALETMLGVSLRREGVTADVSIKQRNKDLLSGRESFRF